MKKYSIFLGIVIMIVLVLIGVQIKQSKEEFFSDGGFERVYLENPIDSHVEIPLNIVANYFVTSSNQDVVYIVGSSKIVRFQQFTNPAEEFLTIDTLPKIRVMANENYYADDNLPSLYIQNLQSNIIQNSNYTNDSANEKKQNSILAIPKITHLDTPLIFSDGKLICFKKTFNRWNFKLSNGEFTSTFSKNKLSEQGHIRFLKKEDKFIYVSLFSNKIIKLDEKFNEFLVGKTIDTITSIPRTKEIGGSFQFASAPRITNSDALISNKYLLIRSLVNADNDRSIKKLIILDLYQLNNLKYYKSISFKNPMEEQPLGLHLLHNNTLLLLYEKSIFVYKIKI